MADQLTNNKFPRHFVEVIVNYSTVISDYIKSVLPKEQEVETTLITENINDFIDLCPKIDLLIIDCDREISDFLYKIKTIVNLTDTPVRIDELKLNLPVSFSSLLAIIKYSRKNELIFSKINNEWLYDEQASCLINKSTRVRLTERENKVFKYLLFRANDSVHKDELLKNIWHYNLQTNSHTIETHLYRLKQKLPVGLMQIKDSNYRLVISDIF